MIPCHLCTVDAPRRGVARDRARVARSAPAGTQIVLRDGSKVLVRQVQSADAPLLADGFARLSAASRWMRFLTPKKELSPAELSYFTDLTTTRRSAPWIPATGVGWAD